MAHYIAIIVPGENGDWRVLFPDVAQCEARGGNLDDARLAAVNELARCLKADGARMPPPRDLIEIGRDNEWLSRHCIDLSKAIVTMVTLVS